MKLILLPGLDGTGTLYERFRAALPLEIELCVVSYPTDQALGYDELEKLAAAALPADEPFILLGESFSGPIAIRLAAKRPAGLCGLILCCSFAKEPIYLSPLFWHLARFAPFDRVSLRCLSRVVLGKFSTPSLASLLRKAVAQVTPNVLRHRMNEALRIDASAALSTIQVPVLYLQATEDRMIPRRAAQHIQKHLPALNIVHIHAPHCLLQANPSVAATAICEWVGLADGG